MSPEPVVNLSPEEPLGFILLQLLLSEHLLPNAPGRDRIGALADQGFNVQVVDL